MNTRKSNTETVEMKTGVCIVEPTKICFTHARKTRRLPSVVRVSHLNGGPTVRVSSNKKPRKEEIEWFVSEQTNKKAQQKSATTNTRTKKKANDTTKRIRETIERNKVN